MLDACLAGHGSWLKAHGWRAQGFWEWLFTKAPGIIPYKNNGIQHSKYPPKDITRQACIQEGARMNALANCCRLLIGNNNAIVCLPIWANVSGVPPCEWIGIWIVLAVHRGLVFFHESDSFLIRIMVDVIVTLNSILLKWYHKLKKNIWSRKRM